MLKISIFGTGYVGLVSGACFASMGHVVTCYDTDKEKISLLNKAKIPIYEPGLEEIVKEAIQNKKIHFVEAKDVDLSDSDIAVIAVGTPNLENGETDLSFVNSVIKTLRENLHKDLTIMVKSTVPLGTCKNIYEEFNNGELSIDVVSNPEFLREGSAVKDFLYPERIVLGCYHQETKSKLNKLYSNLKDRTKILFTDCASSELVKYASNAFLAAKVGFINEMASICEKIGADIDVISKGMGLDSRIGSKFLQPGPGFGGSCFPKDVQALRKLTDNFGANNSIISGIEASNSQWKQTVSKRIASVARELGVQKIHLLGATYKANTDDVRSSAALDIIKALLSNGFEVSCYDPEGSKNLEKIFGNKVTYASNAYDTSNSMIVIATEWHTFSELDYAKLADKNVAALFDLRGITQEEGVKASGIKFYKLGRK